MLFQTWSLHMTTADAFHVIKQLLTSSFLMTAHCVPAERCAPSQFIVLFFLVPVVCNPKHHDLLKEVW